MTSDDCNVEWGEIWEINIQSLSNEKYGFTQMYTSKIYTSPCSYLAIICNILLWQYFFLPQDLDQSVLYLDRKSTKGLFTVLFFRQGWNRKLASFVFVCCRHTSKSRAVKRVLLSRWLSFVVLKKKWEVFLRSELDPKCKIPFYCTVCSRRQAVLTQCASLGSRSLVFSSTANYQSPISF